MERERVALAALTDTIQARQKAVAATSAAADALEQARAKTAGAFARSGFAVLPELVAQMEMEGPAWADYYDKLAEAIQTRQRTVRRRLSISQRHTNVSTAAPRNASVSPVPLVRYVGEWTYPIVNGIFHGAQPESVELEVHEKDGHADGTLEARFKPSPGGANDPVDPVQV